MIEFQWIGLLMCLPLPWLIQRLWPAAQSSGGTALKTPFITELEPLVSQAASPSSPRRLPFLAWLAWFCLVVAAARPQWLGDPVEQGMSGRDLMLAVDLSGSMEIEDFMLRGQAVNRLIATQEVAGRFIERRIGDRVGLILFGERAYLQAPLTFDRTTVKTLLDEAAIGLAGDKTAIGDAIGLAIKRLRNNPEEQRVLILLTDGANTAGEVNPLQAAELAVKERLKIYTIGVGADEWIVQNFLGRQKINPSKDLDETTMRSIADKTQGRYFRARDTEELEEIYRLLDQLEPVERDKRHYRPRTELYPWPLGAAVFWAVWLLAGRYSPKLRRVPVNR